MTTNNHPAHGTVSLDRLHQIREILSKAAAQSDGGNLGYAMADAVKVIDVVIAAFGAEPVGYFYADKPGDWYQISDGDRVPEHRRIPLYSNTQSGPVVKLPNEFISSEGIVVQIEKLMAVLAVHGIQYERKGNACRTAMLQDGNSPVTPDCWIPVSERMPLTTYENCLYEDVEVQVFAGDDVFIAHYAIGALPEPWGAWVDTGADITHWQPLAAAPQQEVKNG
ncbi:DUF551 domain-containing protein [Citrobacter freundii]|uniref:DUF551 domain-containing protein n=1 Tax=Citrobacter freundii TaxID=546 RepID=UPI0028BFA943|nr:DUF551 domain-containing protein [Citrobacter freundii]